MKTRCSAQRITNRMSIRCIRGGMLVQLRRFRGVQAGNILAAKAPPFRYGLSMVGEYERQMLLCKEVRFISGHLGLIVNNARTMLQSCSSTRNIS